ncbi:MAG: hypothetical protein A2Y16_05435 [Tenericutes bacterium GWF2_57_13]|nr:MAG: hypothetical protein A2Y16_05435 [Tenericutes bacterium GWF2_57_13]
MQISYLKPEDLILYKNNPRKNDQAVDMVAESISKFGFRVPIIVDRSNVIITGHTRVKAAIKLGMREVPVIIADDMTEDQIRAFRIVDNRVAEIARWDYVLLEDELKAIELDLSAFQFELPGADDRIVDDDFAVKLPKTARSQLGDLYKLGRHYVMCGDATIQEHMDRLLSGAVIDVVLTDPPYNVNYVGKAGDMMNDNMTPEQFQEFLIKSFHVADSHLRHGGVFYIWHADSGALEFRLACREVGWQVRQCLIWVKNGLVMGRQDYQWQHEPCLYGWKAGAGHYFIDDRSFTTVMEDQDIAKLKVGELREIVRSGMELGDNTSSVIHENKPLKNDNHPTMKPIRLMGRQINNSSRMGDNVLDSFGGSGSTLIAAEQLGRRCYMMELDPRYVDVIIDRFEKMTGVKAEKM